MAGGHCQRSERLRSRSGWLFNNARRCPEEAPRKQNRGCLRSRVEAFLSRRISQAETVASSATPVLSNFQFDTKNELRISAGGGARTHTTLRSLDFESSASAN